MKLKMQQNNKDTFRYITTVKDVSFHLLFIPVKDPITLPTMPLKCLHEQPMQIAIVRRLKEVQISNIIQISGPFLCNAKTLTQPMNS